MTNFGGRITPNPDKKYKLEDLIDIKLFQNLQDKRKQLMAGSGFPNQLKFLFLMKKR